MKNDFLKKNSPNWVANENDYRLVFKEIDDLWREVSGNLPCAANIILADYLEQMNINLPDGCTFMRIKRSGISFTLKLHGAYIVIDVKKL